MEFDEKKLGLVPKEERNFLLSGVNAKNNNNSIGAMNESEFLEKRKKELPGETEEYRKEAERIINTEDVCRGGRNRKSAELDRIRKKSPYAAWRIFDIMAEKRVEKIPEEFEEKLKNEIPEKTEGYKKKAQEILAKKGEDRFKAITRLKKGVSPYVYWRICNIMCDKKDGSEK